MSRILVTGGAGFIGSHVVDHLLEEKHQVAVIDNMNDYYDPLIKQRNVKEHKKQANYIFFQGDILDINNVERAFEQLRPNLVIHLAARVGVRPSLEQSRLYEEVNIRGSLNILEASRKYSSGQVILASSSSVYGLQQKAPFSETANTDHPISPYAATKRSMELLAYTAHHLWGLDCTCLRFFNVYGERGRPDNIPAMFTKLALAGKPLPKFGDGTTQRDYTYVGDIVNGILACRDKSFGYEIINLGNHKPVSLNNFIATLAEVIGRELKIEQHPIHTADVPLTYADISHAQQLLQWNPTVSLKDGLSRYYSWYCQQE